MTPTLESTGSTAAPLKTPLLVFEYEIWRPEIVDLRKQPEPSSRLFDAKVIWPTVSPHIGVRGKHGGRSQALERGSEKIICAEMALPALLEWALQLDFRFATLVRNGRVSVQTYR